MKHQPNPAQPQLTAEEHAAISRRSVIREFTCPECRSHYWGSSRNPDETYTRHCHGHTRTAQGFRVCPFSWHERDDAKHLPPMSCRPRRIVGHLERVP